MQAPYRWRYTIVLIPFWLATARCSAIDFTILVHPGTLIKADRVKSILLEGARKESDEGFESLVNRAATREITDLKQLGDSEGVFVFFEAPTSIPVKMETIGSLNRMPERVISYLDVYTIQPYSFWHKSKGQASPVLLGRGMLWANASQLKFKESTSSSREYLLSTESVAELSVKAIRTALLEFGEHYETTLGSQIIVSKGTPNVSANVLISRLKRTPFQTVPLLLPQGFPDETRIPSQDEYRVVYPITRFTRKPDGAFQLEVELWNRWPIHVRGGVERKPTQLEYKTANPSNASLRSVPFQLKPGEKKTVVIIVDSHPNLTPAMLQNNGILLSWLSWEEEKRENGKPNKGKKKKKK